MKRLAVAVSLAAACTVATGAVAQKIKRQDRISKAGRAMILTGCLQPGGEPDHFKLTGASPSGEAAAPVPASPSEWTWSASPGS